MTPQKKVGRPKVKERKISDTISILPSKKKKIEKLYGSVTAYLNEKLLNDNI